MAAESTLGLKLVAAAFVCLLPMFLPLRVSVRLVVLSSFLSRFQIPVLGRHLRLEQLAAIMLAIAILRHGAGPLRRNFVFPLTLLAILVGWNLLVTLLQAPDVSKSLDIVLWLALDGLLLWGIGRLPGEVHTIIQTGTFCAAVSSLLAILAWVVATAGGPLIGVQVDTSYGGYASYITSIEANTLATTLLMWSIVALAAPGITSRVTRRVLLWTVPFALLSTKSRADMLAYVMVFLLYGIFSRGGGRATRVARTLLAATSLGAFVFFILAPLSPHLARKLGDIMRLHSADISVRLTSWRLAVNDLTDGRWLFGLGTNSYGQRHIDFTRPTLDLPGYLGNLPLQMVYDAGVVGGFVLLALIAILVSKKSDFSLAVRLGVAAYLAVSLTTSLYWLATTYVLLGIALHASNVTHGRSSALKVELPSGSASRLFETGVGSARPPRRLVRRLAERRVDQS